MRKWIDLIEGNRPLETINERGEGYLYHITGVFEAAGILFTDTIEGRTHHRADKLGLSGSRYENKYNDVEGVSLTRNIGFSKVWKSGQGVVLVFDQNKLKSNHSIRPFDYYAGSQNTTGYGSPRSESEEFLIGDLTNVERNLVEIIISQELYDECRSEDENMIEGYKNYEHMLDNPKLRIVD